MTMERPSEFAGGPSTIRVESPGTFDNSEADREEVKESFSRFSAKINELDEQLGRFANDSLRLDQIIGLLSAIKKTRKMLRRTREVFFRNATALLPELFELAHKNCTSESRGPNSEHFFMHPQYFRDPLPPFSILPDVLEQLAQSLSLLRMRINEFREFTDEGLLLKSLLLILKQDLLYRASCAGVYSSRLNTPQIQRYVHQFIDELESDFEKVSTAISEFSAVGVSIISRRQQRSSQNLTRILTAAALFSGVTVSALQISTSTELPTTGLSASSMAWCVSLTFSACVAIIVLLVLSLKETRLVSRGHSSVTLLVSGVEVWQELLLFFSIYFFLFGLILFSFEQDRVIFAFIITITAWLTVVMVVPIFWLKLFSGWFPPILKKQANIPKPSAPDAGNFSFYYYRSDNAGVLSKAFSSLGFRSHRDTPQGDAENMGEKGTTLEKPLTQRAPDEMLRTKLQGNVKNVSMLNSAVIAFLSAGNQHRCNHPKAQLSPRGRLHIDTRAPSVPVTQLRVPPQPGRMIELSRDGTIHGIAYSEDGKWLAVAYAKERTHQSWTAVFDSESLNVVADTWHEGTVIAECFVWSPSGTKLIIKFDHRFDVWDLVARVLHSIERHYHVKDVKWCGDDTFLVAEHNCVFKMNLSRVLTTYVFGRMNVRSIGFERNTNYLILIACVVQSGPERFEPASCRSEKRIIIYDTDKRENVYEVPVLEDICGVQPITGKLDLLVTHKDKKIFQLWSLDAGLKGTQIIPRLKKRAVTPHTNPGDYIGPTYIGGNNNEFVLSVTSTGAIEFWRRESGSPFQRFEARILRDGGRCLSWRRSNSCIVTFATAGGSNLHVWQGEELVLTETPTGSDFIQVSHMDATDSGSVSPQEVEQVEPSRGASLDSDTVNE